MKQNPITAILFFVKDHLAVLIPFSLLIGFIKGCLYPSEPTILTSIIAVFVMILPVFVNLELKDGLKSLKTIKKRLLFIALVLNFVLYPLLALGLGWLFLKNYPIMWLGLVLLSLIPTGSMSVNWTYFTKGNVLGIICIVNLCLILCLLYLPFAMPFITSELITSENININNLDILRRIITVIFLPFVLGYIIRTVILKKLGRKFYEAMIPVNSSISSLGVLIICFIVMSYDRTQILLSKIDLLLLSLIPLVIFYLAVFTFSHFSGRIFLSNEDAKALFYGTAPKYHVIMLAIVLNTFHDPELINPIILMIVIAMTLQIPSLAFYAKFIIWWEARPRIKQEQEIDL